jgi:glyoxylase-like metal-dependent hydrolase (beta-lactamase superfamily II)
VSALVQLPSDIVVFERGWLSSNNILLLDDERPALVDSGYHTHAAQTVALVRGALDGRSLSVLANSHLHSDHCGGNAALQAAFPALRTLIPPGLAQSVRNWDPVALTYVPTGQHCPAFVADGLLLPGTEVRLGGRLWQVHAAPGHDPHSIVLFEPALRVLISADALWANGFGVVFPELEGERAFAQVAATFDLIARLGPACIIPGHGAVIEGVTPALDLARRRLESFQKDPAKHARHAAKVLLKFKLLELQHVPGGDLLDWAQRTSYFALVHRRWFDDREFVPWVQSLIDDLVRSGAAAKDGSHLVNA